MRVQFAPAFIKKLQNSNVRVRNSFKERIAIFIRNPHDPTLRNHQLTGKYQHYRSIAVTADWRALYEEVEGPGAPIAYFTYIGTHKQLYG